MLHQCVTDTNTQGAEVTRCATEFEDQSLHVLQVLPEVVGWSLLGFGQPSFFLSGRWAEHTARALARALAGAGDAVELRIFDRSGHIAGRFLFGAQEARPAAARGSLAAPYRLADRAHERRTLVP